MKSSLGLVGMGSIAGCFSDSEFEQDSLQFDTVHNAVDDLGIDPTGESAIDSALAEALRKGNVLVEFPAGTYFFEDTITFDSPNNWGVRGLGTDKSAVRFVTTSGEGRYLFDTEGGSGQLVENFTLDYSAQKNGATGIALRGEDRIHVQDIEYVGFNPTRENGATINLAPMVLSPSGTAIVDGLVRTGPTDIVSHGSEDGNANAACIWLGPKHSGQLVIRNSHIENTGTNAIYASRTRGPVEVLDSVFRNNNQTTLRIGGTDAVVQNCRFTVDVTSGHSDNRGEYINPNMIIWETGSLGQTGGRIEDCVFRYEDAPEGVIAAVWADGSAGAFAMNNCQFEINTDDVQAIRIDDPTNPRLGVTAEKPWDVEVTDTTIAVSGSGDPIVQLAGRSNSSFDQLEINCTDTRSGVYVVNSQNVTFRDSDINVSGTDLLYNNSTFQLEDTQITPQSSTHE